MGNMRSRLIAMTTLSKQLRVTLMKLHSIYKLTVDYRAGILLMEMMK
jgi:hypothetical protein